MSLFCSAPGDDPLWYERATSPREQTPHGPPSPVYPTCFHKDTLVVAPAGALLPPFCAACGTAVSTKSRQLRCTWHHPGLYWLLLLGLLPYVIVSLIVRRHITVHGYVCPTHSRRRTLAYFIAAAAAVAMLAGPAAGYYLQSLTLGLLITVPALLTFVVAAHRSKLLRAVRIESNHIWLEGYPADEVRKLPPWPNAFPRTPSSSAQ